MPAAGCLGRTTVPATTDIRPRLTRLRYPRQDECRRRDVAGLPPVRRVPQPVGRARSGRGRDARAFRGVRRRDRLQPGRARGPSGADLTDADRVVRDPSVRRCRAARRRVPARAAPGAGRLALGGRAAARTAHADRPRLLRQGQRRPAPAPRRRRLARHRVPAGGYPGHVRVLAGRTERGPPPGTARAASAGPRRRSASRAVRGHQDTRHADRLVRCRPAVRRARRGGADRLCGLRGAGPLSARGLRALAPPTSRGSARTGTRSARGSRWAPTWTRGRPTSGAGPSSAVSRASSPPRRP